MMVRTLIAALLLAAPAYADVVRVEVKSRADVLAGKPFGAAGAYEKLAGTLHFAIDPRNSANAIITDIDKAPKNAAGKVEFSSDFYLIKPKDPSRGNGTLLYEVSNRGGKGMLGFFNFASGSLAPTTAAEFGDGFLFEQGFTLLWVGWQFDPPMREGLVRVFAPIAREPGGGPIRGVDRARAGHGPQLIVGHLLRLVGHGEHDDASYVDPAIKSTPVGRDCLGVAEQQIYAEQWATKADLDKWRAGVVSQVEEAMATALRESPPDPGAEKWTALSTTRLRDDQNGPLS